MSFQAEEGTDHRACLFTLDYLYGGFSMLPGRGSSEHSIFLAQSGPLLFLSEPLEVLGQSLSKKPPFPLLKWIRVKITPSYHKDTLVIPLNIPGTMA